MCRLETHDRRAGSNLEASVNEAAVFRLHAPTKSSFSDLLHNISLSSDRWRSASASEPSRFPRSYLANLGSHQRAMHFLPVGGMLLDRSLAGGRYLGP